MALHLEPAALHGHNHLRAQVLVVIGRRHREIAFLVARAVSQVVFLATGIPATLFRVDEIKAVLFPLIEADVVKNEELGFRAEVRGVGDAGRAQVHLGLARDIARITVIALLGHRINHVGHHHQGRHLGERVEHVRVRIGDEQHVALVDGRPAANGRTVHAEALFKRGLAELVDGVGNVVPKSGKIREAQIQQLDVVLLHEFQDTLRVSHGMLLCASNSDGGEKLAAQPHADFRQLRSQ